MKKGRGRDTYPNMPKHGRITTLAIPSMILRHHRRDCHSHSHKAVMINPNPDDVKPRQPAPRRPPGTLPVPATALGHPVHRPHPILDGLHLAKVLLLQMQVGRDVVAHQTKKGADGKGLVAVAQNLEVDGMVVEAQAQEGGAGVDGHHEQDADDLLLLFRHGIVGRVPHDQVEARKYGYQRRGGGDYEGEGVEGQGPGYGTFIAGVDCDVDRSVT